MGERKILSEQKGSCKVFCVKMFLLMTYYEDLLFEILRILLTVKNNKNMVKNGCFGKTL